MAILGVNPVRREPEKDKLDKIAQGFDIASKVLGTTFNVADFFQNKKTGEAQREKLGAETAGIIQGNQPLTQEQQTALVAQGAKPEQLVGLRQQDFSSTMNRFIETPGAKASRIRNEATLEFAKSAEDRARRSEERSQEKFEKATEKEIQNASFHNRMVSGNSVIDRHTEKSIQSGSRLDFASVMLGATEFADPAIAEVARAERDFVNAVLRPESGAAISKDEFESASKQYFPRPGDPIEVVNQKRQNRIQKIAETKAAAGERGIKAFNEASASIKPPLEGDVDGDGQLSAAEKWVLDNPDDKRTPEVLRSIKVRKGSTQGK